LASLLGTLIYLGACFMSIVSNIAGAGPKTVSYGFIAIGSLLGVLLGIIAIVIIIRLNKKQQRRVVRWPVIGWILWSSATLVLPLLISILGGPTQRILFLAIVILIGLLHFYTPLIGFNKDE